MIGRLKDEGTNEVIQGLQEDWKIDWISHVSNDHSELGMTYEGSHHSIHVIDWEKKKKIDWTFSHLVENIGRFRQFNTARTASRTNWLNNAIEHFEIVQNQKESKEIGILYELAYGYSLLNEDIYLDKSKTLIKELLDLPPTSDMDTLYIKKSLSLLEVLP